MLRRLLPTLVPAHFAGKHLLLARRDHLVADERSLRACPDEGRDDSYEFVLPHRTALFFRCGSTQHDMEARSRFYYDFDQLPFHFLPGSCEVNAFDADCLLLQADCLRKPELYRRVEQDPDARAVLL